jgi:1-acyl-sn-glycerol-3-phosphate acyltransferase|tara:strand:- start:14091 stop:14834 length:744 start_codon:yes stop_codon:yes gene_type:complete
MLKTLFNRTVAASLMVFVLLSSMLLFLAALLIWLATVLVDRRLVILHHFTCFWACLYLWVFPAWSVSIEGREKIDRKKTYIMVSNHQSLVDILVVFRLFTHFKWVSKNEVFRIPLIGWNMLLNRYVGLVRGEQESIVKMYEACDNHLQQGSSIYMFPEGTRSPTGQLREFKEGAFVLAKKHQLPILTIAINGSRDALPKHSLNFHGRHHIVISVLGEIPYSDFADTPVRELAYQVRDKISQHVVLSN